LASTSDLIIVAIQRLQAQVPAFAKLKLVLGLELTVGGLTGPGESERYRIELPGPKVDEGAGEDERIQLSVPRTMFTVLAEEGQLVDWREAFQYGHLKAEGDRKVLRLLGRTIERSGAS
jgi:hypothetical protein